MIERWNVLAKERHDQANPECQSCSNQKSVHVKEERATKKEHFKNLENLLSMFVVDGNVRRRSRLFCWG